MGVEKSEVDELVEHGTTIKDIISDLTKDGITIIIVLSVVYMAVHNNTIDILKNAFEVIIGYWIGTRGR